MFKFGEKHLLYKNPDALPVTQGAKQDVPKDKKDKAEIREKSTADQMAELGAECAESLTQTTASQVMIDLFGTNCEEAKMEFGPEFMNFYRSVEATLAEGWKYKGIKALSDDINVLWEEPNGETDTLSLKEYVDEDKYEVILDLLSTENKAAIAEEKEKLLSPKQRAEKFIEKTIFPFIKERRPKLKILGNYSVFLHSDLVREELLPILEAGYSADKPHSFVPKQNGFILKGADKNWPDQEFNFYSYDDNFDHMEKSIERNMNAFMANQVIPIIKKYRPYISNKQIAESYMFREEIMSILYAGYAAKQHFQIRETQRGFTLSNKFELFNSHRFNFDQYDENLNLLTGQKKPYETEEIPEQIQQARQIAEARPKYYDAEWDDREFLKNRLWKEGATPENMASWETNFDTVVAKSGLPANLSVPIKDILFSARQKIDSGEIRTREGMRTFLKDSTNNTNLDDEFSALREKAEINGDIMTSDGLDLIKKQTRDMAEVLEYELKDELEEGE